MGPYLPAILRPIGRYATLYNVPRVAGQLRCYAADAKDAADAQGESAADPRVAELEKQLADKSKEAADLKDRLLRSVADFRNLQEVTRRDVQKARDFALQRFSKDLLESLDNFGHALGAVSPEALQRSPEIADLHAGVRLTRDVFEKTLLKHGIAPIDALGQPFDPNLHEATFELPQPDKTPGTVFHVQQPGYTLNGRVIRPAKVGVVKDPDA
ncbi:ACR118Wp [Eremothecium gossypii ATCC 10895]|uniref:GrpE protein homolog, mitochondrial n=1 Tax=Eremothecium gossypii (strain ATCC 10895 / CBS 109.51 / FGSC 9923 / NRRL Y-1056) TaxID=284811 RepID=GRPE_EREGS|nr:ACR118Wp [Eremothecium gossypii ATCC 10895]Q75C01.1 RecName: Full=GrpE protein homolog, mitochondrial; Flags: Precursor [Eremothecium gossypii ATCC 10895]AAS51344.1 ACR118Wp [Eremothecium gossypii ATCC 10895]